MINYIKPKYYSCDHCIIVVSTGRCFFRGSSEKDFALPLPPPPHTHTYGFKTCVFVGLLCKTSISFRSIWFYFVSFLFGLVSICFHLDLISFRSVFFFGRFRLGRFRFDRFRFVSIRFVSFQFRYVLYRYPSSMLLKVLILTSFCLDIYIISI